MNIAAKEHKARKELRGRSFCFVFSAFFRGKENFTK